MVKKASFRSKTVKWVVLGNAREECIWIRNNWKGRDYCLIDEVLHEMIGPRAFPYRQDRSIAW